MVVQRCRKCDHDRPHRKRSDNGRPRTLCVDCSAEQSRAWRQQSWQRRKLYDTWKGMVSRCHDPGRRKWLNAPSVPRYDDYGAKGVKVCARWRSPETGFLAFVEDMGEPPHPSWTLDRKRPRRGYSPSNCRWADTLTQKSNRKNTRWITAVHPETGECLTLSCAEWARRTGLRRKTISQRLQRGWDPSRAVIPLVLEGVPF